VETLIVVALAALLLYSLACAVWPFRACRRCAGSGKLRSPSGKAWRPCGRCNGKGRKLRFGRWLWDDGRS
jgi:hypothetical protein